MNDLLVKIANKLKKDEYKILSLEFLIYKFEVDGYIVSFLLDPNNPYSRTRGLSISKGKNKTKRLGELFSTEYSPFVENELILMADRDSKNKQISQTYWKTLDKVVININNENAIRKNLRGLVHI